MGKGRTVFFDFDGTLADTVWIAVSVYRKMMGDAHQTDDAAIERMRGLSARQVIKVLGISWWRLPGIVYLAHKSVRDNIGQVKSFPGIESVLQKLHTDNVRMFIVSTNSKDNINQFLQNNNLSQYFERTYNSGLFDKATVLANIARKNGIDVKDCVYVGDEVRDVEATRKIGMPCIAVTWGYNNRQALEGAKAEVLVDSAKELTAALSQKLA